MPASPAVLGPRPAGHKSSPGGAGGWAQLRGCACEGGLCAWEWVLRHAACARAQVCSPCVGSKAVLQLAGEGHLRVPAGASARRSASLVCPPSRPPACPPPIPPARSRCGTAHRLHKLCSGPGRQGPELRAGAGGIRALCAAAPATSDRQAGLQGRGGMGPSAVLWMRDARCLAPVQITDCLAGSLSAGWAG